MRHLTTLFAVVALVGVTECADGAAVVEAPGAPAPAAQESAPTEIIPVDDVAKSQSGSVWQRVANTEITVTYDRPVARARAVRRHRAVWRDLEPGRQRRHRHRRQSRRHR